MDDAPNLAIFCDFDNLAIGATDARFDKFDIHLVLERLLDKGKIVIKKAYADWERYRSAKRDLHAAAFELIEIPHVSLTGKNSADIRMVVDVLDLCYTKSHLDVFVIVSGDSDFSPLVSKLRESNKTVIGLGIKNASSQLLVNNCDEFIYYDDLVREKKKGAQKKANKRAGGGRKDSARGRGKKSASGRSASPAKKPDKSPQPADGGGTQEEALELILDTVEALFRERDDNLWGSMVKQTLKRKRPQFSETFYGYRTFNQLLEDAQRQGLLELQKDERSGGYLITSFGPEA